MKTVILLLALLQKGIDIFRGDGSPRHVVMLVGAAVPWHPLLILFPDVGLWLIRVPLDGTERQVQSALGLGLGVLQEANHLARFGSDHRVGNAINPGYGNLFDVKLGSSDRLEGPKRHFVILP